jgi:hypothetical protein
MKLSDLSISRPVLAVVMSLLLVVLGVMSFTRLTLRELPAIDPPIVSVSVDYTGASAAVVESRITQVLEDALAGIEGIGPSTPAAATAARRSASSSPPTATSRRRPTTCAMRSARADRMPEEARPPEIAKVESMPSRSSGSTWSRTRWTRWSCPITPSATWSIASPAWTAWPRCASAGASAMRCASGWTATSWPRAA